MNSTIPLRRNSRFVYLRQAFFLRKMFIVIALFLLLLGIGRGQSSPPTQMVPVSLTTWYGIGVLVAGALEAKLFAPLSSILSLLHVGVAAVALQQLLPISDELFLIPVMRFADTRLLSFESAAMLFALCLTSIARGRFRKIDPYLFLLSQALVSIFCTVSLYLVIAGENRLPLVAILAFVCIALSMVPMYMRYPVYRVLFLKSWVGVLTRNLVLVAFVIPIFIGFVYYFLPAYVFDYRWLHVYFDTMIFWGYVISLLLIVRKLAAADSIRRRAEYETLQASQTDALTSLLNRYGMEEALGAAWNSFAVGKSAYGVVIIDIDHFKSINDTYGHGVGDHVLSEISRTMKSVLRPTDAISRWGGEEFVIVIHTRNYDDVIDIAERLRAAIEAMSIRSIRGYCSENDTIIFATASVGVSFFYRSDTKYRDALERADAHLLLAKETGRNKVMWTMPNKELV